MGIMGAVSGAVLNAGGDVTGIVPYAMVAAGGEVDQTKGIHAPHVQLKEKGRERVRSLTVSIGTGFLTRLLWYRLGGNCEHPFRDERCSSATELMLVGQDCCELHARTESGDGTTVLRIHRSSRWIWHIRRGALHALR